MEPNTGDEGDLQQEDGQQPQQPQQAEPQQPPQQQEMEQIIKQPQEAGTKEEEILRNSFQ
jgi:hypothetical protein